MNGDDGNTYTSQCCFTALCFYGPGLSTFQAPESTPDWMADTEKLSPWKYELVKEEDITYKVRFRTADVDDDEGSYHLGRKYILS